MNEALQGDTQLFLTHTIFNDHAAAEFANVGSGCNPCGRHPVAGIPVAGTGGIAIIPPIDFNKRRLLLSTLFLVQVVNVESKSSAMAGKQVTGNRKSNMY